jgi:hypothetical protein
MALQGDEELRARLAAIGDRKMLLQKVALLGVAEAKKLVPRRTSNLSRTIRVERVTETNARVIAGGTSQVGYARYVEEGTGIHGPRKRRITPRRAKMLSWVGGGSRLTGRGSGSRRIFAKSVAGRKATPYLVPGVKRAVERAGLREAIVKAWNDAA